MRLLCALSPATPLQDLATGSAATLRLATTSDDLSPGEALAGGGGSSRMDPGAPAMQLFIAMVDDSVVLTTPVAEASALAPLGFTHAAHALQSQEPRPPAVPRARNPHDIVAEEMTQLASELLGKPTTLVWSPRSTSWALRILDGVADPRITPMVWSWIVSGRGTPTPDPLEITGHQAARLTARGWRFKGS